MPARRSNRGFTVIELLAVIGMITVVLTLVLPAVQASRESAKAIACKNNLKMLGLAMHNYHDVYLTFPPGWVLKDDAAKSGPAYNWQISILPYVDQAPLFNAINFHQPPSVEGVPHFAKGLKAYRCPADTAPAADENRDGFGTSNYAGNYGVDKFPGKEKAARKGANGIFHLNSRIGVRDITDGTSNTLMIGERGEDTGAGIWPAARSNEFADDVVASCHDNFRINDSKRAFSGKHGGGCYFLLCDGSVKFLTEKIESSPKTDPPEAAFQKLAHRADNRTLDVKDAGIYVQPTGEKAAAPKPSDKPWVERPRTKTYSKRKQKAAE